VNNQILFCIKCEKTVHLINPLNRYPSCSICHQPVLMFDKETAKISSKNLLDQYDQSHPYNPLGDYKGKYQHFPSPANNVEILECEDILKRNPNHIEALGHLAHLYLRENDYQKSRMLFEKMILLEPDNQNVLKQLAYLYKKQKDYKKSLDQVKKLLKLFPQQPGYLENAGILYLHLSRHADAVRCFIKAYQLYKVAEKKERVRQILNKLSFAKIP